jgi:prepilin-type N-terminal cleavage/methylation domain-containing protein
MKLNSNQHAFTLVEMAMVLVIISLIIAGVIGGKSLVFTAKMRSTIKDLQQYQSAVLNFLDIYKYYPGDFPNASNNWTSVANGNGDWIIQCTSNSDECYMAWLHLSQAGLVPGKYTGTGGSSPKLALANQYIPASATGTVEIWNSFTAYGAAAVWFGSWKTFDVLSIYKIDAKIDDGIPTTGLVVAYDVGAGCIKQVDGTTNVAVWTYVGSGVYNMSCSAYVGMAYAILFLQ